MFKGYSRVVEEDVVFACLQGHRRVYIGANNHDEVSVTKPVVAGNFVAAFSRYQGRSGASIEVRVINLLTGEKLHYESDGTAETTQGVFGRSLAVSRQGAAAWISDVKDGPRLVSRAVHKVDAAGVAVLQEDTAIDLGSLAVGSNRAYWTAAGQVQSYEFMNPER